MIIKDLEEKQLKYLNKINIPELKDFCEKALEEFSSEDKLNRGNKVADIVWEKFVYLNYITKDAQQQFVDITIAAALLYNLFYDENDISTILLHRTKLNEIEKETKIDERLLKLVYELIEGQLGENHIIQKLKPSPNSPGQTLADAIWIVDKYNK